MPTVSVIVPNYNHAQYLEKRLSSIAQQTYDDYELIILDDCSTDDSRDIIETFARTRSAQVIYNPANSGNSFKQWNKGIGVAAGDYVWIAESDDVADNAFLEATLNVLEQNPNIGLVYCQSHTVNSEDQLTGSMLEWTADLAERRWTSDFVNQGIDEVRRYLSYKNTIPNASAVLFRRSTYQQVGGADTTFRLCGDWMVWVKMLLISDVAYISTPMNYFRQHSNTVRNSSSRSGDFIKETYRVVKYIRDTVGIPPEIYNSISRQHLGVWSYCMRSTDPALVSRQMHETYEFARSFDATIGRQELGEIYLDLVHFHKAHGSPWARRFLLSALTCHPQYLGDRGFRSTSLEVLLGKQFIAKIKKPFRPSKDRLT